MGVKLIIPMLAALYLLTAAQRHPIWHTYQRDLISSNEAMVNLRSCFMRQKECTPVEQQVKGVFEEQYLRDCASCCSFRRRMVVDIKNHWNRTGMPIPEEEMMEILTNEVAGIPSR